MSAFASALDLPGDVWSDVVEHDRQYLLMVFIGFIVSFGFIRLSTRLIRSQRFAWWPGNIEQGGVHVHHMVFGILTMTVAGVVSFSLSNTGLAYTISAFAFGVGLGLTLDEFALWFYVRDVYWEQEGRLSVDLVLLAAAAMGIALVFTVPFNLKANTIDDLFAVLAFWIVQFGLTAVCLFKQRFVHGTLGLLVPGLSLYGAVRLGKPSSPWARRRYDGRNPGKQARAVRRFPPDRRTDRVKQRLNDLIGGRPIGAATPPGGADAPRAGAARR
jgi:lysyl-tRNA synthetase class 2